MIEFKCRKIDRQNNNTPIVSNRELDEFAHAVLLDYQPHLLREPGRIRFEHFLEYYLKVNLEFHDIYSDDPDRPILGATAFHDGELKIFNREQMCISKIPVAARTVIIDNSVMKPGKEGLALFTGLHEGGHVLVHSGVYASDPENQISPEDESSLICCRRGNIESFGTGNKTRSAADWREHHADYFAAAIAMPNATFVPVVNQLLREQNFWKGQIVTGRDEELDYLAEYLLPECISEIYGVSKKAAFIKLKKVGFVMDKKFHDGLKEQTTL